MVIIESNKAYREPQAKVVVMGVRSVLCISGGDGTARLGNSSTEQLEEENISDSIW